MSQESAYVPAPYNGISQSAPQVRLLEQAADLQDIIVDLPDGARKRPPLKWLGKILSAGATTSGKVHAITDPDDASLRFLLMNNDGGHIQARLFDGASLANIGLTVSGPAQTYLDTCADPLKSTMRIAQAVDYSMIVSRNHVVGVDGSPFPTRPHEALVWVKSGAYGKKYQLLVQKAGGPLRTGTVVTPSGDTASDSFWVATDHIAGAIAGSDPYTTANGAAHTSIQSELATDGFTVTIKGAVIYLAHTTDFTVAVQDDQGGTAMIAVKDTVNNFSDLPADGVTNGFTVSVIPSRGDKQGAYYVTYNTNPSRGQQKWQETVAPGGQKGFALADMPVAVYKDGSGDWQCDRPGWKQRTVGDQTLAIDPLFVGDTIQDVGFAFGRLIILSQEECFLSAADDPFRVYPATLTTQIDSDPISLNPPSQNARFRSITTWSSDNFEGAFLTGLKQQAILRNTSDGPVTPTAVKLNRMSAYELREPFADLRPLYNNNKAYLPIPLGDLYTGIREMKLDRSSGETLGDDMTAAQPKYLPAGINVGATCQTNFMAMYGVAGTNKIYTHLFRYNDNQRVQNGLFTWNIPTGWLLMDIISVGTVFYFFLVCQPDSSLHVFTMETNPQSLDEDPSSTVLTKLDMRVSDLQAVSVVYSPMAETTTIVGPLPIRSGNGYVAARAGGTGPYPEGYLAEVVSQPTATSITVKGNWAAQSFYFGEGYVAEWTPSTINKYSPQDNRIMHGSLTLDRIWFDLKDASSLTVKVQNGSRSPRSYSLRMNNFGLPTLYTGEFIVPVKGLNKQVTIRIRDEGHIGATISGFEWEGDFIPKMRRTT